MRLIRIIFIFLIVTGFGYAQNVEKRFSRATIDPDGIQRIHVLGGDYFFEPDHIILRVNIPVEMTVRKEPTIVPHNIVINASDAGIDIKESLRKDPTVIKFTPTKVGTYPFECSKKFLFFRSHKEKGMKGIIKVIE
jgi:plastocyanin domain-containing protein